MKQKTLTGALEIMCETRHAFKLIHKELLEQQEKVYTDIHRYNCLMLRWLIFNNNIVSNLYVPWISVLY